MELLKCPVCNLKLNRNLNTYKCEENHSYDISSKGYVNLLLANQHHSFNSGDSKESIISRTRFLDLGYYHILRKTIFDTIVKYLKENNYSFMDEINFCDLACGEGYYTNYIHQELSNEYKVNTVGVDISKAAIIEACNRKRANKIENVDYFIGNLMNLPFLDNSFDVMLNCFAPMDDKEFNRVLKDNGIYIRVLPDANHLLGIKKQLYENVILNVMKEKELNGFTLIDEIHIEDDIRLKNSTEILDLFKMTPYYYKTSLEATNKLINLPYLDTPISFVLLVYKKA